MLTLRWLVQGRTWHFLSLTTVSINIFARRISCGGPRQAGKQHRACVNKIIRWSVKLQTATGKILVLASNVSVGRRGGLPFLLALTACIIIISVLYQLWKS